MPRWCSRAPQEKPGHARPLFETEASVSEIGELGARRFFRGAEGTPRYTLGVLWGKPSGPPFFWFVFFGGAKKMNSPGGAKKNLKCTNRLSKSLQPVPPAPAAGTVR
jgi:hypothetical protein